jgi:hypothetical protein
MRAAGEIVQLRQRLGAAGRFCEKAFAKRQCLVGTDDVMAGMRR